MNSNEQTNSYYQVPYSEWVINKHDNGSISFNCKNCGAESKVRENFCPKCGACMLPKENVTKEQQYIS